MTDRHPFFSVIRSAAQSKPKTWSTTYYQSTGETQHCRKIIYQMSNQGSLRILELIAYPFSRGLPDPGVELASPVLQADSLPAELPGSNLRWAFKCLVFKSYTTLMVF